MTQLASSTPSTSTRNSAEDCRHLCRSADLPMRVPDLDVRVVVTAVAGSVEERDVNLGRDGVVLIGAAVLESHLEDSGRGDVADAADVGGVDSLMVQRTPQG